MNLGNPDRPVGGLAVPRPAGVELRPLGRDDLAAALALVGEYHGRANADPEPHRMAYEALLNDADAAPFLAIADGAPAGLIDFRFRRRLNHATFEGWVGDLIVAERSRGRGIGRLLLAAGIAEWRLRGGHQVEIEITHEQVAARGLVEALGFTSGGKVFELAPIVTRQIAVANGVEIRPIATDDADFDAATRLLAELGRPTPTDEKIPALRRTYEAHVASPDTASMIALRDGQPVGFISLELRDRLATTARQAWIPDLIVTDAARGQDIGAALLDAAFVEAGRRNASSAVLESGHHRAVAHRLYATAGMRDTGSYFTLAR